MGKEKYLVLHLEKEYVLCEYAYPFKLMRIPVSELPQNIRIGDLLIRQEGKLALDEERMMGKNRDLFELMKYLETIESGNQTE